MKKTKYLKTLFVLVICTLAVNSYAYYDVTIDGNVYRLYDNGEASFYDGKNCHGDIVIPENIWGYPVTKIAGGAFNNNNKITSVIIGNNVKIIYHDAFRNCKNLKKITLGKSVENIEGYSSGWFDGWNWEEYGAFNGCNKIEMIVSVIDRIFPIDERVFDGEVYYNAQLLVPIGQKEKYKQATGWKNFLSIEEVDFFSKHNLTFLVDGEIYEQYQLGYEEETTKPKKDPWKTGYDFLGWSEFPQLMSDTDIIVNAIFSPEEKITVWGQKEGYATFYHGGASYQLPEGIIAQVVTGIEGAKIEYKTIADGDQAINVVPKGVPVMLVNKEKRFGSFKLTLSPKEVTYNGPNLLRSIEKANTNVITATPRQGEYVYKLCQLMVGNVIEQTFGWFWGAENGGSFDLLSNFGSKAWLAVPIQNASRGFALGTE